jgi:hypothetical protein
MHESSWPRWCGCKSATNLHVRAVYSLGLPELACTRTDAGGRACIACVRACVLVRNCGRACIACVRALRCVRACVLVRNCGVGALRARFVCLCVRACAVNRARRSAHASRLRHDDRVQRLEVLDPLNLHARPTRLPASCRRHNAVAPNAHAPKLLLFGYSVRSDSTCPPHSTPQPPTPTLPRFRWPYL